MEVYCILDATHYPVAIYVSRDKAYADLAKRNLNATGNLCYMVRSRVVDFDPSIKWKDLP